MLSIPCLIADPTAPSRVRLRRGMVALTSTMAMAMAMATAFALTACSPTLDWRDTPFPEADGAQALFPCKPDRVTRRVRLAGDVVRFAMASCSAGTLTFAFSHVEVADAAQARSVWAELQQTAAANVGSTSSRIDGMRVAGAAAEPPVRRVSLQGRRLDGAAIQEEALFFSRARRVYQVSVIGTAIDPETVDTFFAGVKLPD